MDIFVKFKNVFREMRVNQWFKNTYILFPIIWGAHVSLENTLTLFLGFLALACTSSIVYILNDIKDIDADRQHPEKKKRPIAAGLLSMKEVLVVTVLLAVIVCLIVLFLGNMSFAYILAAMLAINVIYTNVGKKIPYIELFMIGVLYMFRTASGFVLLGMPVPVTLLVAMFFLTIFFMAGQRVIELTKYGAEARAVLKRYSVPMIRKFLVVALMGAIIFYFITTAYLTGPLIYTDVIALFVLIYVHEIFISEKRIKEVTDNTIKLVFSNKLLLFIIGGSAILVILYSILF